MPFVGNEIYVEETSNSTAFNRAGHISIEFIKVNKNVINELAKIKNGVTSLATYYAWNRGYFTKSHIYQFNIYSGSSSSTLFEWSDIDIQKGTVTNKSVTLQATMGESFAHKCMPIFNTSSVYYYDSNYLYKIDLDAAIVTVLVSGLTFTNSSSLFYSSDKSHNLYLAVQGNASIKADIQKYNVDSNTMTSICNVYYWYSANIFDVLDNKYVIYNEYAQRVYEGSYNYAFNLSTIGSKGDPTDCRNEKYFPSRAMATGVASDNYGVLSVRPFLKYPVFINLPETLGESSHIPHSHYHRYIYDNEHGLWSTVFANTKIEEYNDSFDMYILKKNGKYTYDTTMINECTLTSYSGNGEPHDYYNNIVPSWFDMTSGNSCMSIMYYNGSISNYLAIITYKEDN